MLEDLEGSRVQDGLVNWISLISKRTKTIPKRERSHDAKRAGTIPKRSQTDQTVRSQTVPFFHPKQMGPMVQMPEMGPVPMETTPSTSHIDDLVQVTNMKTENTNCIS